jgi:amidase
MTAASITHPPRLHRLDACAVVELLRRGVVSAEAALEAAIERVAEVNPAVNALVLPDFERARVQARALDRSGEHARLPLAGLPLLVKDLSDVEGLPTTLGDPSRLSPAAAVSDGVVERLVANGAIVFGKSNVPFMGLGSDTSNPAFGLTRNPWGLSYSTAGSSGGAAAALACGMAWLAHGTDLGGSIRGPASHCGVVGLRPTPGRVGHGGPRTRRMPLDVLNVDGPMARSVADLALFFDAMVGETAGDPIAMPRAEPPGHFLAAACSPKLPRRVAASLGLGQIEVHADVAAVWREAVARLEAAGVEVVHTEPDCAGVADAAYDLRLGATRARTPVAERQRIAPHLATIAAAMHGDADALTLDRLLAAQERQQLLVREMALFFETHELLITPAVAWPAQRHHGGAVHTAPTRGRHWAEDALHAYGITLSHCPALVLPAGFSTEGLPIGLQLVAPFRGEAALIRAAAAIEPLWRPADTAPIDPRPEPLPSTHLSR